jgi:hypothetical protein
MANDLATMLKAVQLNKGKKRFCFAFGTGKRHDGLGHGHLVIARNKPKKALFKEEFECQTFVEGNCWSSVDGGTIYFISKTSLGTSTVAKMALTAKQIVGKPFDFQIPPPEEETRGNHLSPTWPPWPGG